MGREYLGPAWDGVHQHKAFMRTHELSLWKTRMSYHRQERARALIVEGACIRREIYHEGTAHHDRHRMLNWWTKSKLVGDLVALTAPAIKKQVASRPHAWEL